MNSFKEGEVVEVVSLPPMHRHTYIHDMIRARDKTDGPRDEETKRFQPIQVEALH